MDIADKYPLKPPFSHDEVELALDMVDDLIGDELSIREGRYAVAKELERNGFPVPPEELIPPPKWWYPSQLFRALMPPAAPK